MNSQQIRIVLTLLFARSALSRSTSRWQLDLGGSLRLCLRERSSQLLRERGRLGPARCSTVVGAAFLRSSVAIEDERCVHCYVLSRPREYFWGRYCAIAAHQPRRPPGLVLEHSHRKHLGAMPSQSRPCVRTWYTEPLDRKSLIVSRQAASYVVAESRQSLALCPHMCRC